MFLFSLRTIADEEIARFGLGRLSLKMVLIFNRFCAGVCGNLSQLFWIK